MDSIATRLQVVRTRIENACLRYERDPATIRLLAVSKTKRDAAIRAAADAGQQEFGENYLQEALGKIESLAGKGLHWHFIGAVQSNKTRQIATHFDWVHTLASAKHARRLSDQRPDNLPPLKVLIQVNISDEPSKAGIATSEAIDLARQIATLERLELRGLMAIPRAADHLEDQRVPFRQLAELRTRVQQELDLPDFNELSMGMSEDADVAIAEGSTWLRIGTAIFGPRN